ncbi:alpha/beta fold hydrolase [Sphingomonas corticis]|uniref:alpha/beta fold hydrolase n=1 Tax=Sphingomonas corticis TaxID=2722791 RepID=UPI001ADD9895
MEAVSVAADSVASRVVAANGVEFHLLEIGAGPLVLCLHGFPDHARSFVPLMRRLAAAGYRVVAPNLRGFWPTGPAPDGCYLPWATGGDAVALVQGLGVEKAAALVGHDWGAAAAYAAARTAPERFARLVAMSVPEGGRVGAAMVADPVQQKRSWYMYFFQMPIAEAALAHHDFALVDRLWEDWSPGYALPAEAREDLKAMFRQPGVPSQLLAYYRQAFSPVTARPEWTERSSALRGPITVPTLYLHGRDDGCIGPEVSDGMEASFAAGLTREVIEGGHFLQLERPDLVADRILAFLEA